MSEHAALAAAIADGARLVATAIEALRLATAKRLSRIERRLVRLQLTGGLRATSVRRCDQGNSPLPAGSACSNQLAEPAFCHVCGTTQTEGEPIAVWVMVCPTCAGSIIHAQVHDCYVDPEDP